LGDKNNTEEIYVKDVDDKALYAIKVITKKDKKAFNLIVLDINSGKILADNPISGLSEETLMRMALSFNVDFNHKMKIYPDKIVFCNINVKDGYKFVGYARMIINKTDYSITTNTISYKDDLKKFIPNLDDLGGVESGYVLVKKDMFFLKDGSVAILTEKYNASLQNNSMKTSDMVYIYTDKDFKIKDVKILKKEKSKNEFTDYLFSQYLNNDENVVFFYKDFQKNDETKDKNWILFINSLIKGEFKREQVVISSKKDNFLIVPYIGKDGYILLREYNEKEKYNQIRLEKLNF
jgi:hypothetical protein